MIKNWSDLSFKEKTAYLTAYIAFALGWILTIVNFFIDPITIVADTTLWILGQALLYVGGVVGITQYCNSEINGMKKRLNID